MTEQATLIPTVPPVRADVDLDLIYAEGNGIPIPDQTLVNSILRHGLQHPLVVSQREGENLFRLIAGRRRYAALRALGHTTAPVLLYQEGEVNEDAVALAENAVRGPNIIEEMDRLVNLFGGGMTEPEVIAITGMSSSTIRSRMKLTTLIFPAVRLVLHGRLGEKGAKDMAGLPKDVQQALVDAAGDGRITEPMIREAKTAASQKKWGALRMDELDELDEETGEFISPETPWRMTAEYHLEKVLAVLPPEKAAFRDQLLAIWAMLS